MKNIYIAQYYTKNLTHGPYSEKINSKYCDEHGYGYYCEKLDEKIRNTLKGAAPTWYKSRLVKDVFDIFNPEYVLFLDTDAIISDFSQKIESFVDNNYDLIVSEDVSTHSLMNAGVFLIKNSEWSRNFLNNWFQCAFTLKPKDCSLKLEVADHDLNTEGFYSHRLWMDQTALTHLYKDHEEYKSKIKIISNRSFNWHTYKDNNFIFHAYCYGTTKNRTIDLIHDKIFNIQPTFSSKQLNDIGEYYGTDKQYLHDYYNRFYQSTLAPLQQKCDILEIGVLNGASLKVWKEYFNSGHIHGIDINSIDLQDDRIKTFTVDQSQESSLLEFKSKGFVYDIIIDDGSHKMRDQQITIQLLFDCVVSGGLFIIEDLQTSLECPMPEKAWCGWGDPNKTTCLEMLQSIQNGNPRSDYKTDVWDSFIRQVDNVFISSDRNDSIYAVIKKK